VQFHVEIEATARCDFGINGYRPLIPYRKHDPDSKDWCSVNPCAQNFALKLNLLPAAISVSMAIVFQFLTITVTPSLKADAL
jgi:hypothetical protein